MNEQVFKSKADLWLLIVLWGIGLVLSILFYTRYIIRDRKLIVRCGPFVQRIEIGSIRTIKRQARTILSSPRLSLDTIGIQYNKYDDAFISPRRKEDFIRDLKAINPSIEVQ